MSNKRNFSSAEGQPSAKRTISPEKLFVRNRDAIVPCSFRDFFHLCLNRFASQQLPADIPLELLHLTKDYLYRPATDMDIHESVKILSASGQISLQKEQILLTFGTINGWDTSLVTDMSWLFLAAMPSLGLDLRGWDTSNVVSMQGMFAYSKVNPTIGQWNVSKVRRMDRMFQGAEKFNQPLNQWNTGKVEYMQYMFAATSKFDQPLNGWDVKKVRSFRFMFASAASFNNQIDGWQVVPSNGNHSKGNFMLFGMFANAKKFNRRIDWLAAYWKALIPECSAPNVSVRMRYLFTEAKHASKLIWLSIDQRDPVLAELVPGNLHADASGGLRQLMSTVFDLMVLSHTMYTKIRSCHSYLLRFPSEPKRRVFNHLIDLMNRPRFIDLQYAVLSSILDAMATNSDYSVLEQRLMLKTPLVDTPEGMYM